MHVEYLQSSNDLVPQFPSFSFFFFFFFFILIIPTAVVLDTSRKERERTLGGPVWSQALEHDGLYGFLPTWDVLWVYETPKRNALCHPSALTGSHWGPSQHSATRQWQEAIRADPSQPLWAVPRAGSASRHPLPAAHLSNVQQSRAVCRWLSEELHKTQISRGVGVFVCWWCLSLL